MNWQYSFARRAERDLESVNDDGDRSRIFEALDRLAANPVRGDVDVTKLGGTGDQWRLRVGRWRVIFEYDRSSHLILVTRVLPRNEGTYRRR